MKKFFANILSTFLALILFLVFGVVFMIFALIALSSDDVKIAPNSVLEIELDRPILDRTSENPFEEFNSVDFVFEESIELKDILDNIERAKKHDNIQGIYLKTSLNAGFSQVEEIRNKLLEFKNEGKFIYAYSETFSQLDYYLCSVADQIFLHPEGYIDLSGISAGVMFYKDFLDKIGVEVQIIRHGKYKAAVEPFMYNSMSKENREQLEKLLNAMSDKIISDISVSRNISEEKINETINRLSLNSSSICKDLFFVDNIFYEDQVLEEINEEVDLYEMVSYADFAYSNSLIDYPMDNKIAIIYATGDIISGEGSFNTIGSSTTVEAIQEAKDDEGVKAIVLRINSPGGSALASDVIWREINLAKEEKKVVVSMGDYAASGGYYIACNADRIFANSTTITGSIGVFGLIPNTKELLSEKLGINVDTVNTHKYSDILSGSRKLTEYETSIVQKSVEDIYETFISHVSDGRGMSKEIIDSIGQGRVWSGQDALSLGLVDEIGGLEDAINSAADLADIEDYSIITLPAKEDIFEEIIGGFSAKHNIQISEFLGISKEMIDKIEVLYSGDIIQARIPFFIEIN